MVKRGCDETRGCQISSASVEPLSKGLIIMYNDCSGTTCMCEVARSVLGTLLTRGRLFSAAELRLHGVKVLLLSVVTAETKKHTC